MDVDEADWDAPEEGLVGRQIESKALMAVAVEEDGEGLDRIRLRRVAAADKANLHTFIRDSIEPGSTVRTDGLPA